MSEMSLYVRTWHPVPKCTKIGSWRRAHSIHEFLIEHSKNKSEGCEHKISWKTLSDLRELCNLVLAHQNQKDYEAMAQKYLPNDFADYGEYYKVYLQDTIRIIDRLSFAQRNQSLIYKEDN